MKKCLTVLLAALLLLSLAQPAAMAAGASLMPVASGTLTVNTGRAVIDYSNTKDGYVMVNFTGTTATRIKVRITGPTTVYDYALPVQTWVTFPLSDGNGTYSLMVLENTTAKKYAKVATASFQVTLADEFAPFLRPNQYVNYSAAPNTLAEASKIVGSETDALKKVELIYSYVVKNLTYDKQKAASVQSGYLPVLDTVLAEKKGICFDYASLMADPTFASSSNSSKSIMQYIGDGSNYTTKYLY